MSAPTFKTGRAGNMTFSTVVFYITKWQSKLTTTRSDSTSSASFDAVNTRLWTTSEAGSTKLEGSIEGWFDFSASSNAALSAVLSGVPVPAVLKFDATTVYASGSISLMDFDSGVEVKEDSPTVGFTSNFESYGPMVMFGG